MKKILLLFGAVYLSCLASYGQTAKLYVGPSLSFHQEERSRMIYGPGYEERNSLTHFFGAGVRVQKKFKNSWGLHTGFNLVTRQYKMTVPFDHCFFLEEGQNCLLFLAHVDSYGYKTIEIPIGINKYLVTNNKFELYLTLTALTAFDYQSFYNPYLPKTEKEISHSINLFSNSFTGGLGLGYSLTERIKLNAESFVRFIHRQRKDPILFTGYEKEWTHFDNLGGHLLLLYRL